MDTQEGIETISLSGILKLSRTQRCNLLSSESLSECSLFFVVWCRGSVWVRRVCLGVLCIQYLSAIPLEHKPPTYQPHPLNQPGMDQMADAPHHSSCPSQVPIFVLPPFKFQCLTSQGIHGKKEINFIYYLYTDTAWSFTPTLEGIYPHVHPW